MGEQTKNMMIGFFVIAACVLIIWFIMFLKPSVGDMKKTYYIRFSDINQINIGTRVTLAGKPVGEVVAIGEIYNARQQPSDSLGRQYFYQLTVKVDSSVSIYNTDEIVLQTSGLLGEKSVNIIPKPSKGEALAKQIPPQDPIYATSVDPIENAFTQLSEVSDAIEKTADRLTEWIDKNGQDLAATIRSIGQAMTEVDLFIGDMRQEELVGEVKRATQNFSCVMEQVDDAIAQMRDDGVFTNIGPIICNVRSASESIEAITRDISQGKGTIGKLIMDDDLYLRLNAIMSKADTVMNDINHYGILFHLNKSWQRMRTKRMTLLNALDTPQGFKDYFTTEVDQINTSMARLSKLVDKAQESPNREKIFESEPFRKDFLEFLRLTDELSDNLKLYNQQLMEAQD